MARIYLARHGQTAWNKEERFRGRKDVFLSDQGKQEAEAVADFLESLGIDHIFASPLARAVGTLSPLARRVGKQVQPLPDLIDMNFGEWEGMSTVEVEKEYPALFAEWKTSPHKVTFPGGESLRQAQARAMRAISRLALQYPDGVMALCTHRVVSKLIMLGLLGIGPEKFWVIRQDTACVNLFEYSPPEAVIFKMNDTHHLSKLGGAQGADF